MKNITYTRKDFVIDKDEIRNKLSEYETIFKDPQAFYEKLFEKFESYLESSLSDKELGGLISRIRASASKYEKASKAVITGRGPFTAVDLTLQLKMARLLVYALVNEIFAGMLLDARSKKLRGVEAKLTKEYEELFVRNGGL